MTVVAGDSVTRGVAAHGLSSRTTLPDQPLDDTTWRQLMWQVEYQRLAGLLVHSILEGDLSTTDEQWYAAEQVHIGAMSQVLALERVLLDVAELFRDPSIEFRVLKGPSFAYLDYPSPELRSYADVDLLVRTQQFELTVQTLTAAGFERQSVQFRDGFDMRFGKGASFRTPDGMELDLHRTLVMGPYGLTVSLDDLWSDPCTIAVGGEEVPVLGREERLLSACYHAVLGNFPPRLLVLRDVAQILLSDPIDFGRVRAMAAAWRAEAVVARAIVAAWSALELETHNALTEWATRYVETAWDRRALAVYLGTRRSYGAKAFAAFRVVPGLANKASFAVAMVVPSREFVTERGGYLRWWAGGVRNLVRSRP